MKRECGYAIEFNSISVGHLMVATAAAAVVVVFVFSVCGRYHLHVHCTRYHVSEYSNCSIEIIDICREDCTISCCTNEFSL